MKPFLIAAWMLACAHGASLAREPWTREEVLALAGARAPELAAAPFLLEEARQRLEAARVRLTDNPVLEAGAGPRQNGDRTTDLEVGIGQDFEAPGRRRARIAAAEAGVDLAQVETSRIGKDLLRRVALAWNRALFAQERQDLLRQAEDLASQSGAVALRRLEAGDVTQLDVNLVRATEAQARSDRQAVEALVAEAAGELRGLLGLPEDEPFRVAGSLESLPVPSGAELRAGRDALPELRLLEAQLQQARAEQADARALARPGLGWEARYSREEHDRVLIGAVAVRLPVWNRGKGELAAGAAREQRLAHERDALRGALAARVHAAELAYLARRQAVATLAADALPLASESEALVLRGYEEGENGIGDVLLVRREALAARTAHLERLLEMADAVVELEAAAGMLR